MVGRSQRPRLSKNQREIEAGDREPSRGTSETDAAILRAVLRVRDGAGGDYWWVECSACDCSWQVPHHAESVG